MTEIQGFFRWRPEAAPLRSGCPPKSPPKSALCQPPVNKWPFDLSAEVGELASIRSMPAGSKSRGPSSRARRATPQNYDAVQLTAPAQQQRFHVVSQQGRRRSPETRVDCCCSSLTSVSARQHIHRLTNRATLDLEVLLAAGRVTRHPCARAGPALRS